MKDLRSQTSLCHCEIQVKTLAGGRGWRIIRAMSNARMLTRTMPFVGSIFCLTLTFLPTLGGEPTAKRPTQTARRVTNNDLQGELDAILNVPGQSKLKFAGRVIELPSGRVIYDHDGKAPLMPASNMKLIIIAAAIDHLGPDFQFQTICAIRDKDLVVIGSGDPTFGDE